MVVSSKLNPYVVIHLMKRTTHRMKMTHQIIAQRNLKIVRIALTIVAIQKSNLHL